MKSLNMYHLCLVLISQKLILPPVFCSGLHNNIVKLQQNIYDSIKFAQRIRYINPFTVRFINFHNDTDTESETETVKVIWSAIESHPKTFGWSTQYLSQLEPDTRKQKALRLQGLNCYSFFTIIYITQNISAPTLNEIISKTINPKLDFVLLLLNSDKNKVFPSSLPILKNLLNKIVLNIRSPNEIWIDPLTYLNGEMIALSSVPKKPLGNPRMGLNLRGRHFQSAISQAPPYCFQAGVDSKGKPIFRGVYYNLINEASKSSAFNFTFDIVNDGLGYGKLLPNGTWTGKYARIHYPNSGYDFALQIPNHILLTRGDRSSSVNVVEELFVTSIPKKKLYWYAFLLPFETLVWFLTILAFFALGVSQSFVVYFWEGRQWSDKVFNVGTFLPLSIALEQGADGLPKSLRNFSLILMLGCLILGTGYKSTLRSHLMFPRPEKVPLTFEELANAPDFKITFLILGNIERNFFLESELNLMKKLKPRLVVEKNWMRCLENAFFEEKHVCITWSLGKAIIAKKMTLNTTIVPFLMSKGTLLQMYSGIGFQENSIFVNAFELIVSSAFEMGLTMRWENEIMFELKKKGRQELLMKHNQSENHSSSSSLLIRMLVEIATGEEDRKPLKVGSLVAVFGLIFVGIFTGFMSLVLELCYHKVEKGYPSKPWSNLRSERSGESMHSMTNLNTFRSSSSRDSL
ncbi:unnamed protein product [Orchesella dallaii]|uniref:Uncharacterized protein n=1 Tax=Orchesella dallaii TaxID=48710 RepID=A0ABP1RX19_9HEXA